MTNNCTTPNKTLLSVSALAAILVATGTVAAFVAQPAAAQQYSIPKLPIKYKLVILLAAHPQ
ncbi:MAG: hypothetical protein WCA39_07110 [Nitrososphaeraceae archaeon]